MRTQTHSRLHKLVTGLAQLPCWYVSCGGSAGPSLELALGRKMPRPIPLRNDAHPEEFRRFEGEASLFVWCAWRVDGADAPVTSWDDEEDSMRAGLNRLVGARVRSVTVRRPAWDLAVRFSNRLCLRLFCDHVPGNPSFAGNWDLRTQQQILVVGPGGDYRFESRRPLLKRAVS